MSGRVICYVSPKPRGKPQATPRSEPHLPGELYREIATKLHQRRDKDVLLSLALVNSAWRHESQRVLFSSPSSNWAILPNSDLRQSHILFLESILAHPDRLGPYVYVYAQDGVAIDPTVVTNSDRRLIKFYQDYMHIWDLTSRALPAMINLKRLFLSPIKARSMAKYFLIGCRFQLETLVWDCEENSQDKLIDFLQTQRVLRHLEIGRHVAEFNLSWLKTDICPTLTSIGVCNMESVGLMEQRRDIVALKLNSPVTAEEIADNSSVLDRIKYLSVWISPFSRFSRPTMPGLFLLEIQCWSLETLQSLSATALPNLRVLTLLDDNFLGKSRGGLVHDTRFKLCFSQLPKLETIFIRSHLFTEEMPFGYHTRVSLNRADPDAVMKVGWVLGECQLGLPWWSVYETMLEEREPSFRILV